MSIILCDRLTITGDISERTPLIVIKEIAKAHRIDTTSCDFASPSYIRAIINTIRHNSSIYRLKLPLNNHGKKTLARYLGISNSETWSCEELTEVWKYWENMINDIRNKRVDRISVENIGPINREHWNSLNACFLYRICSEYSINLPFNCCLEVMQICINLKRGSGNAAVNIINQFTCKASQIDLINVIANIPLKFYTGKYPEELIENVVVTPEELSQLANRGYIQELNSSIKKQMNPKNSIESVALGAYNFGINLLYASNAYREYTHLKNQHGVYIPSDRKMKEIYDRNPDIIMLNRVFDPRIPKEFYSDHVSLSLVENEGHLREDLDYSPAYELLEMSYLSENFYKGWFPNIRNETSPFLLTEVSDIKDIICYGCLSDSLVALSMDEIAGMFSNTGSLKNIIPGFDGFFTDKSIRKLRLICQLTLEAEAVVSCIRELNHIESLMATGSRTLQIFSESYKDAPKKLKRKYRELMKCFLDLAMYTRGWDGIGPLPITVAPVDNQAEVDVRVTDGIILFEEKVNEFEDSLKQIILALPLIDYDRNRFIVSNDIQMGRTLGERIEIMKRGENGDNINSCIRLTSNWFTASAYRYYQVLKLDPPFDIEVMRHIS